MRLYSSAPHLGKGASKLWGAYAPGRAACWHAGVRARGYQAEKSVGGRGRNRRPEKAVEAPPRR